MSNLHIMTNFLGNSMNVGDIQQVQAKEITKNGTFMIQGKKN